MKQLRIKRVISIIDSEVYDIAMPSFHNFILANGAIAHNCSHSTAYSLITYACMFLKHHYPLEWWSSVISNATEQEITGKLWPYVKDLIMPPDINLSGDSMTIDYANGKIRSKLGMIRGMGDASIEPIVANRPYKDIQDFVNKEVAGPSLSRKLIHVGVLDSLFPPSSQLLEKLRYYEEAVQQKKYAEKVQKAKETGKKLKVLGPKAAEIPEEYLTIQNFPMKEAAMKKAVLPTMPIDLFDLGCRYSKALAPFKDAALVVSAKGYDTKLVDGITLKKLSEIPAEEVEKDVYVACTCYVIKSEEFPYAKNTKKALKLILDCGNGFTREFVWWPNYDTGQLVYPEGLKRGVIATFFMKKREQRQDLTITGAVLETNLDKDKEEK